MAGSSGNGRSMSKVVVGRVWEWDFGGNGCRRHNVLGIGVVGWHPWLRRDSRNSWTSKRGECCSLGVETLSVG